MSALAVAGFNSSAVFVQIEEQLKTLPEAERKAQVQKVKGVFQFNSGTGAIHKGTVTGLKADITIDVSDDDFVALSEGKANGQKLFMAGKIKAKGAIMLATKLDAVLKSTGPAKAKL
ncbi:hypothetical protein BG011_009457 [Mortierella polycephala]|uniref:SCP2 domain-containing protein n=1 Tax=Mortierella polycephala TaxID=41804 RepID=A0A9P6TVQ7_9FUNG|nr:hypothetical protein BG011_009457 [Mortierella polycephala]